MTTPTVRAQLADARLYLCTDGRRDRGDLVPFLDAVLGHGVDIVQLREKGLEAGEELALLEVFAAACERHGALLAVNDRADVALAAGADVLHLGQDDLPVAVARRILGPGPVIGRSSHSPAQALAASAEEGVDYFCAGPVWATPTKAGRPGTGLGLVSDAAGLGVARPWFAIGGISLDRLDAVLAAGASRVVVVRALTEANDPGAAAAAFSRRLRGALSACAPLAAGAMMRSVIDTAVPSSIAAYMRAAAGRQPGNRIGPFRVGLDAHSDHPMRNYAVPDDGAAPDAAEIAALVGFFRSRGRIPRLEYVEDSAPGVWPALAAAGFALEQRLPVLVATPDMSLTPRVPAGITFRSAVDEADLLAAATVQHRAYDEPEPPQPDDVARLRRLVQRGGVLAIAVDDASGAAVSSGLVDVSGDCPGVGELAAVATVVEFRRRGIASALSAFLAGTAHAQGIGLVFLEAEPAEEAIYRRTGFTDATTKLWAALR